MRSPKMPPVFHVQDAELEIDSADTGRVTNVHAVKSLGAGLDDNCARAAQHWTFESRKGAQTMKVECHFALPGKAE